jgi:hypothetical protein
VPPPSQHDALMMPLMTPLMGGGGGVHSAIGCRPLPL